jgi:hypothetical protein
LQWILKTNYNGGKETSQPERNQMTNADKKARKLAQWNEALDRAQSGSSMANFETIYDGFENMGIDADDIEPRENVLTYNAWRAKGRQVRKGQHGVKILTWIPASKKDESTGKVESFKVSKLVAVFHITQTQKGA